MERLNRWGDQASGSRVSNGNSSDNAASQRVTPSSSQDSHGRVDSPARGREVSSNILTQTQILGKRPRSEDGAPRNGAHRAGDRSRSNNTAEPSAARTQFAQSLMLPLRGSAQEQLSHIAKELVAEQPSPIRQPLKVSGPEHTSSSRVPSKEALEPGLGDAQAGKRVLRARTQMHYGENTLSRAAGQADPSSRKRDKVAEEVLRLADKKSSSRHLQTSTLGPGTRRIAASSKFSAESDIDSLSSDSTQPVRIPIFLPPKQALDDGGDGGAKGESSTSLSQQEIALSELQKRSRKSTSRRSKPDAGGLPRKAAGLTECPFCGEDMPRRPSAKLVELLQSQLDRCHQSKRRGKATDAVEACAKHRQEYEIIPNGRKEGWPKKMDVGHLRARLESPGDTFKRSMEEIVEEPGQSQFMQKARSYRKEVAGGSVPGRLAGQMLQMQAGYYGETGWEVFRSVLTRWFMSSDATLEHSLTSAEVLLRIEPFGAMEFIDLVLIPELTCRVIQQDYALRTGPQKRILTLEEAGELKQASSPYGIAMFPAQAVIVGGESAGSQSPTTLTSHRSAKPSSQPSVPTGTRSQPELFPSSSAPVTSRPKARAAKSSGEISRSSAREETPPSSQLERHHLISAEGNYHTQGSQPHGTITRGRPKPLPLRRSEQSSEDFFDRSPSHCRKQTARTSPSRNRFEGAHTSSPQRTSLENLRGTDVACSQMPECRRVRRPPNARKPQIEHGYCSSSSLSTPPPEDPDEPTNAAATFLSSQTKDPPTTGLPSSQEGWQVGKAAMRMHSSFPEDTAEPIDPENFLPRDEDDLELHSLSELP
ncbi:unnamed protein product [Parajaminaea phylloscopi]